MIPAHKNSINPPGQIVNKLEYPSKTMGQIVNDVTLTDYYERKMKEKLTFNEWLEKEYGGVNGLPFNIKEFMLKAWKAAQENA